MKTCPNCGKPVDENAVFCVNCGAPQKEPVSMPPYSFIDPYDHTEDFDPDDISFNKVIAMLPYIMSVFGVIIALLAVHDSPYVGFHVRQALKMLVCEALLGIISVVLVFTFIVPFAGAVCIFIIFVLRIIAFFQVCSGKAKEPAIICKLGFLK